MPVDKSRRTLDNGDAEKFRKLLQIEQAEIKKLRLVSYVCFYQCLLRGLIKNVGVPMY